MKPHEAAIVVQVAAVPTGEPSPLTDEFPYLHYFLDSDVEVPLLVRCEELQLEMITDAGMTQQHRDFWRQDGFIYWLDSLGDDRLLRTLSDSLKLELTDSQIQGILGGVADKKRRRLVDDVRRLPDVPSRFARLLPAQAVRRHLPAGLLEAVSSDPDSIDDRQLARLAHAAYGVDLLREFRNELERPGIGCTRAVGWRPAGAAFCTGARLPAGVRRI